jgi:hypothetical protein
MDKAPEGEEPALAAPPEEPVGVGVGVGLAGVAGSLLTQMLAKRILSSA